MKKYGMFHGRFQPFHNGHLKICLEILKSHEEIIIAISNPTRTYPPKLKNGTPENVRESILNARKPENNPWGYWDRYNMIRSSLIKSGIKPERVNIIPRFAPYDELPFNWDNILPKKEDVVVYINMKDPHHDIQKDVYMRDGWDVKEFPHLKSHTSATEVRRRIRSSENWEELVPEGTREVINSLL